MLQLSCRETRLQIKSPSVRDFWMQVFSQPRPLKYSWTLKEIGQENKSIFRYSSCIFVFILLSSGRFLSVAASVIKVCGEEWRSQGGDRNVKEEEGRRVAPAEWGHVNSWWDQSPDRDRRKVDLNEKQLKETARSDWKSHRILKRKKQCFTVMFHSHLVTQNMSKDSYLASNVFLLSPLQGLLSKSLASELLSFFHCFWSLNPLIDISCFKNVFMF